MCSAMVKALSSFCELQFVGPINPKPSRYEHVVSKTKRMLKLKGAFYFFSEARLRRIAEETEKRLSQIPHEICLFHGFTPWIECCCPTPYLAWSDCTFSQYISVFHDRTLFSKNDLERIIGREANWLKGARRILFRNKWAAEGAISEYCLDRSKVGYVGNYGLIDSPTCDSYNNEKEFLFVSTNFRMKGGVTVVKAFELIRKKHPGARLTIIGDAPPPSQSVMQGICYEGFLRKENPAEKVRLAGILARTRALVHPTTADTNAMILIEAGYFGCPAISTRICGIPEIIDDGKTGILLEAPPSVSAVAAAMERLLLEEDTYLSMRRAVRERMNSLFSERAFQNRLWLNLQEVLPVRN